MNKIIKNIGNVVFILSIISLAYFIVILPESDMTKFIGTLGGVLFMVKLFNDNIDFNKEKHE
jgi:hypothetical protein